MCSLGFHPLIIIPHCKLSEASWYNYYHPHFFNVYMDNRILQLHRQSEFYSVGSTVENHIIICRRYRFVCSLCERFAKLLDISHAYSCNHDIECDPSQYNVMYIDSRGKAGNANSMTIGGKLFNVVTSFSNIDNIIICNDLSHDAGVKVTSKNVRQY